MHRLPGRHKPEAVIRAGITATDEIRVAMKLRVPMSHDGSKDGDRNLNRIEVTRCGVGVAAAVHGDLLRKWSKCGDGHDVAQDPFQSVVRPRLQSVRG